MLDLQSVRLFVLAAEFGSLTRAAEAAGTVQPVVSQRLKALELRVGARLLERTSRFVRLTTAGAAFLPRARALLDAHDLALHLDAGPEAHLRLGLSEHALGLGLEGVLRRMRSALPGRTRISLTMGLSHALHAGFEAGGFDAIVVRREVGGTDGEVLGRDRLGWRGNEAPDGPVPLATLRPPCGVREAAILALEGAGMAWQEVFIGGSCTALMAGVRAGFGVAPMGQAASDGAIDVGPRLGLPPLPDSEVVLFGRTGSAMAGTAVRALAAGVRARLGGG